jgi:flavin-dependent dehydrogenase
VNDVDVVVAGGGPVGLACAIEAVRLGLSVAVVEPRPGPVDKACGEGLMPGAVAALDRLGVQPSGMPLRGISYVGGRRTARHAFRAGPGLGVRRTELQGALSRRADALGVRRVAAKVDEVTQDGRSVSVAGVTASWLLACDGLHSTVRRRLGLDPPAVPAHVRRYGLRRHAAVAPWSEFVEVHWSPLAEAYVTPVAPDLVGIALLTSTSAPYDVLLGQVPTLRSKLDVASWATPVRGCGPLHQPVARRVAGRVLLVGDAAGYVDALTGEGIRTGLACAEAAVAAVAAGRPAAYEAEWRRLTRSYRLLTRGLLASTRPQLVRRHVAGAAQRVPAAFGLAVEALAG